MRKSILLPLVVVMPLAAMVVLIVWMGADRNEQSLLPEATSRQRQLRADPDNRDDMWGRPIIYSFYAPIPGNKDSNVEFEMIELWRHAWIEAGWRPKVLGLGHAEQHPDFYALNARLNGMPFGYYERLCFLRWIAMAQVGEGFMVDYDTFPLHTFVKDGLNLPNKGKLSIFDGYSPTLVSGSQDEWLRMAKQLIENAHLHKDEEHWSDQNALRDVYQNDSLAFQHSYDVLHGADALMGSATSSWDRATCMGLTEGKRAVHFSRKAIRSDAEDESINRPKVVAEWLSSWKEACDS